MPNDTASLAGGWRIEGIPTDLANKDTVAELLVELSGDDPYPPPYDVDYRESTFSWGAAGAGWEALLWVPVGTAVVSVGIERFIDYVSAKRSNAENVAWFDMTPDRLQEADETARWYLESSLQNRPRSDIDPLTVEQLVKTGERHEGNSVTFTYERGDRTYEVGITSKKGYPVVKWWSVQGDNLDHPK